MSTTSKIETAKAKPDNSRQQFLEALQTAKEAIALYADGSCSNQAQAAAENKDSGSVLAHRESVEASAPSRQARSIEIEICSRCGGSGKFSYCQMYGDTCFRCHGSGRTYTKRGAAANTYLNRLRSRPASCLTVGNLLFIEPGIFNKGGFSRINSIEPDSLNQGLFTFATEKCNCGLQPSSIVRAGQTAEGKRETLKLALDYQDSLTKQGKLKKGATFPDNVDDRQDWLVNQSLSPSEAGPTLSSENQKPVRQHNED